jgi:hypothetical protein
MGDIAAIVGAMRATSRTQFVRPDEVHLQLHFLLIHHSVASRQPSRLDGGHSSPAVVGVGAGVSVGEAGGLVGFGVEVGQGEHPVAPQ